MATRILINVPLQVAEYCHRSGFHKELGLYVSLAFTGKSTFKKAHLKASFEECGIASHKTAKKRLDRLISKNWIGYNKKTGTYHINGFRKILVSMKEERTRSVKAYRSDIRNMASFCSASIMGVYLKRMAYAKTKAKQTTRPEPGNMSFIGSKKGLDVVQKVKQAGHVGMTVDKMAEELGIPRSTASWHKKMAKMNGYAHFSHVYVNVWKGIEGTGNMVANIKRCYPEYKDRVRKHIDFATKIYTVGIQVHDQGNTLMDFTKGTKWRLTTSQVQ